MMSATESDLSAEAAASNAYIKRLHCEWTPADQATLEQRLANDAEYALAYRLAEQSIEILKGAAQTPEIMRFREEAFAHARQSNIHRWAIVKSGRRYWGLAAGFAGIILVAGIGWQLSPWAHMTDEYRTGIGEQRIVELADRSRVILDARTQLSIRYTDTSRTIELREGQAQFSVASDLARPFSVKAGQRTIRALGTVFTVDYTTQRVNVILLEGKVVVTSTDASSPPVSSSSIPLQRLGREGPAKREGEVILSPGQALRVDRDGRAVVTPKADLEAATGWREGRLTFRTEPLVDAIERMNRYSRMQIEVVDPDLAKERISGVYEAGDTHGFIAGIQLLLPVIVDTADSGRIQLRRR